MKEKGHGIGARGLGAVIGLGFLMMGSAVFSRDTLAAGAEADPRPAITVLVFNYAQASLGTLAGAQREAGRILGEAGVSRQSG